MVFYLIFLCDWFCDVSCTVHLQQNWHLLLGLGDEFNLNLKMQLWLPGMKKKVSILTKINVIMICIIVKLPYSLSGEGLLSFHFHSLYFEEAS